MHDRFQSLPVWRPSPLTGALVGDLGRYLLASALVLGLGFALGFRPDGGVGGTLAALGLVLSSLTRCRGCGSSSGSAHAASPRSTRSTSGCSFR